MDRKEVALRQKWAVDKLAAEKEAGEDLIARLARKLIDHYVFFEQLTRGEELNLDTVHRFAAEAQELIASNLPLFMQLSVQGKNTHPIIDERVQR